MVEEKKEMEFFRALHLVYAYAVLARERLVAEIENARFCTSEEEEEAFNIIREKSDSHVFERGRRPPIRRNKG